ncbi:MAG: 3-dehydroquinate synthase [Candidatus Promineifilaceae bacterium]
MAAKSIILTGFMGTGKTTVGRLLAAESGRAFMDSDEWIVERAGKSVADIFAQDGEAAFRAWEAQAARALGDRPGLVVATGGRLMLDPANALRLGRDALVICLTAEPATSLARLAGDARRRPLLAGADAPERIGRLLAEREAAYRRYPQVGSDGRSPEQVAAEVLALVESAAAGAQIAEAHASAIHVAYPGGGYAIHVGRGLLARLGALARSAGQTLVVTDSNVGPLYAGSLDDLNPLAVVAMPAGEASKNLNTLRHLYAQLVAARLERRDSLVALGGGVVGDLAGFAAATYLRGIGYIPAPTSLLAMVDASLGGKVGVDLAEGKNLVGAFKQPAAVVADLDVLQTLPAAELAGGLAEVIKHGLLAAPWILDRLENGPTVFSDPLDLQLLIVEAIQVKKAYVEADPYEAGRRAGLNLGHTFAHALEAASDYRLSHGRAVALGLLAAACLSERLGLAPAGLSQRVEALLGRWSLPGRIPAGIAVEDVLAAMGRDKKRAAGRLGFVLLAGVGEPLLGVEVAPAEVEAVLRGLL